MKLTVAVTHRRTVQEVVEFAVAAENAGIEEVWLAEDPGGRGIFTTAAEILSATTRVVVGLGVVPLLTRHPYAIAAECASAAERWPGRMILGLGTGTARAAELLSVPRPRLRDLIDASALIRELLAGGGEAPLLGTPAPEEVPIVWGVGGVRATTRAAELADGVHLSTLSGPDDAARTRSLIGSRRLSAYCFTSNAEAAPAVRATMTELARSMGRNPSPGSLVTSAQDTELWSRAGLDNLVLRTTARIPAGDFLSHVTELQAGLASTDA